MYLIKVTDGSSCRLLLRMSQDVPEGQLQRGVCSIELLMQDKRNTGNSWQQCVSA